jgi:hypothetical protein
VQYIIRDLDDRELNRTNDARSAWDLIEAEWPDSVVSSLTGPPVRDWIRLDTALQDAGAVVVLVHDRTVVGVAIELPEGWGRSGRSGWQWRPRPSLGASTE